MKKDGGFEVTKTRCVLSCHLMTAHGCCDSRVCVDLGLLMMTRAGIEFARSACRLILLACDSLRGLLTGTVFRGKGGDTPIFCITLGETVFTHADAIDTICEAFLHELSSNTIGHIVLCDGGWGDDSVAGAESLCTSTYICGGGHRHGTELLLLPITAVGKNVC